MGTHENAFRQFRENSQKNYSPQQFQKHPYMPLLKLRFKRTGMTHIFMHLIINLIFVIKVKKRKKQKKRKREVLTMKKFPCPRDNRKYFFRNISASSIFQILLSMK